MRLPQQLPRAAALLLAAASAWAQAGTQVGVNVTVHEPGFYGRVEIGQQPPPRVIYTQPIIIQQTPIAVVQRPIYLRVPPEHHRRWAYYCARYRACGQPVYFVDGPVLHQWRRDNRERWDAAREAYVQKRHEQMQDRHERRGDGRRDGRDERGYDRGDDRRDHGRDRGHRN